MRSRAYILTGVLMLALWGCSTTGAVTDGGGDMGRPEGAIVDSNNSAISLADYLRKAPGVMVTGSGDNIRVTIHGPNTFQGSNEPLFVIDGHAIGGGYMQAASYIDVHQIDYVKVLKGQEAAYYGVRGGNGVIEIVTKSQ